MTKEYPYTFDSWKKGKCSEVVKRTAKELEEENYRSTPGRTQPTHHHRA